MVNKREYINEQFDVAFSMRSEYVFEWIFGEEKPHFYVNEENPDLFTIWNFLSNIGNSN